MKVMAMLVAVCCVFATLTTGSGPNDSGNTCPHPWRACGSIGWRGVSVCWRVGIVGHGGCAGLAHIGAVRLSLTASCGSICR